MRAACARVVEACACEGVRRTARAVTRHYERALAPSGLKATQFPILVALQAAGPLTLSVLADVLGLERTTLTRNLRGLQDRSLVEVVTADDRRERRVSLTSGGRSALEHALQLWERTHQEVTDQYGGARLDRLLGELAQLCDVVRD